MSWIGTSPSPPRSARSSTALIAYSPFAEIRIRQHALVVFRRRPASSRTAALQEPRRLAREVGDHHIGARPPDRDEGLQHGALRSEEHTSELQSQSNLVCRLLLEKKKRHRPIIHTYDAPAVHHQCTRRA